MKFIFPQNYHFKNKIFGIIDYTTAFVNLVWYIIVFILVNLIFNSVDIKVFVFITFCFPLLLLSFSGFHGENIVVVIRYLIKFIFRQKLYFYSKKCNKILKIYKNLT